MVIKIINMIWVKQGLLNKAFIKKLKSKNNVWEKFESQTLIET